MCRNIRTLFNFEPPVTDAEIRAASLQFVRKISGFNTPSKRITRCSSRLSTRSQRSRRNSWVVSNRRRRRRIGKKKPPKRESAPVNDLAIEFLDRGSGANEDRRRTDGGISYSKLGI